MNHDVFSNVSRFKTEHSLVFYFDVFILGVNFSFRSYRYSRTTRFYVDANGKEVFLDGFSFRHPLHISDVDVMRRCVFEFVTKFNPCPAPVSE